MKKLKAFNCPFCGSKPIIKPYPNGKGASVECSSNECALWGFKADLNDWNQNRIFKRTVLEKYLFDFQDVYIGAEFDLVREYVCQCCGASGRKLSKIRHRKNCEVKKLKKAAS